MGVIGRPVVKMEAKALLSPIYSLISENLNEKTVDRPWSWIPWTLMVAQP